MSSRSLKLSETEQKELSKIISCYDEESTIKMDMFLGDIDERVEETDDCAYIIMPSSIDFKDAVSNTSIVGYDINKIGTREFYNLESIELLAA